MRLRFESASRWPRIPPWAAALAAAMGLLVLVGVLVERWAGLELDTCLFHRITGHACPTCGSTRAVLALASGRWGGALHFNPLVTLALLAGAALLLLRLSTGRALRLEATPGEHRALLAVGLAGLLLNWAWVLHVLG